MFYQVILQYTFNFCMHTHVCYVQVQFNEFAGKEQLNNH